MAAPSSNDLARAQKIGAVCAAACGLAAIILPATVVLTWAFESPIAPSLSQHGFSSSFDTGMRHYLGDPAFYFPSGIKAWQRLVGGAISAVPHLIMSYGLLRARRALLAFARGEFFVPAVGGGLRDYAGALFWSAIADLAMSPALSLALTFANPPGHGVIKIGVDGDQLFGIMSAGILWVLAIALVRATALARENEQFV